MDVQCICKITLDYGCTDALRTCFMILNFKVLASVYLIAEFKFSFSHFIYIGIHWVLRGGYIVI